MSHDVLSLEDLAAGHELPGDDNPERLLWFTSRSDEVIFSASTRRHARRTSQVLSEAEMGALLRGLNAPEDFAERPATTFAANSATLGLGILFLLCTVGSIALARFGFSAWVYLVPWLISTILFITGFALEYKINEARDS
jgi:hypothetical protein